jgi:uncharacterized membrane protein YjgN (DUF898 family)
MDTAPQNDSPKRVGQPLAIAYEVQPGLGRIALVNALLFVLTLTIYRFWAKTNVRRHIWNCVRINGEPLEYTGTGTELFLGALIVFGVFILPFSLLYFALAIAFGPEHPVLVIIQLILFLIIAVLWGMALYRARRYQLSRTLWRGIRSTLAGSPMSYSLLYFGAMLLRMVTFGWSTPAMNLNLQERMTGDMRFGSMPFRFKGHAGPLYGPYAVCWFLALATFIIIACVIALVVFVVFGEQLSAFFRDLMDPFSDGPKPDSETILLASMIGFLVFLVLWSVLQAVIWAFYSARELAIFASYTTLDLARLKLDATGGSLIALTIGNLLLIIFTLGIATPFAQQRLVRYLCDRLSAEGTVDIDSVLQSPVPVGRTGEGLADAFDVGGL